MSKPLELAGRTFGGIEVLARLPNNKHGRSRWQCRCSCGKEWPVEGIALTSGDTTSCGCQRPDRLRAIARTHGKTNSPEYRVWTNIKTRCYNRNRKTYHRYGGRGIRMCDRWRDSFEAFLSDMGPRPSPKHEIEREDNDGDYEPGNCCWATRATQIANTSVAKRITHKGETHTVAEWSRRTRVDKATIRKRLRAGLPLDEVFRPTPGRWRKHQAAPA